MDYIMRIQERISTELNEAKVGKILKVIVDREEPDFYVGRSQFDSPEVDPEILISKEKELKVGEMYFVEITDSQAFDLYGKIVD